MSYEQIAVISVLITLIFALVSTSVKPSTLFVSAVAGCYLLGLIEMEALLGNYTNASLITLVMLLLVSLGIEKTALVVWLGKLISRGRLETATAKLGVATALLSSFTNNTAVVATLITAIKDNGKFAHSKLLIPLSYTAILGGTLTLIGTSTNLIVDGFLRDAGLPGLGFFEMTPIGIGVLIVGLLVLLIGVRFLPEHQVAADEVAFYLQAKVATDSPLIGRTVEQNGLRELKTLFLAEIVRGEKRIVPVSPKEKLLPGDCLLFVGNISQVNILNSVEGLVLEGQSAPGKALAHLVEVVVSHSSSIVGKSLKQSGFRQQFDAAVVGIRRGHEQLTGGLGEIALKPGDCLILAPGKRFAEHGNLAREFIYMSGIEVQEHFASAKSAAVLAGFFAVLVNALVFGGSLVKGLVALFIAYLLTGIVKPQEIKRRFPLDIFLMVGAAIGLAKLVISSGVAGMLSDIVVTYLNGFGVIGAFVGIYLFTLLLTELITNNAAAALCFPVAFSLSQSFDANYMPFIMAVMFGASASFISPFGYQTNLMVFSAGNYQLKDYVRIGIPMSIAYSLTALILIPQFFPF